MNPSEWPESRAEMRSLTPDEFEQFVAEVWEARGYVTEVTRTSRDAGKDVLAKKDGRSVGIQAKRYNPSNRVGGPEIQQYGSLLHDETIDEVTVVTSSSFTNAAHRRAQEIGLDLVDGERLLNLADRYQGSEPGEKTTSSSSPSGAEVIGQFFLFPIRLSIWLLEISIKFTVLMFYVMWKIMVFTLKALGSSRSDD